MWSVIIKSILTGSRSLRKDQGLETAVWECERRPGVEWKAFVTVRIFLNLKVSPESIRLEFSFQITSLEFKGKCKLHPLTH